MTVHEHLIRLSQPGVSNSSVAAAHLDYVLCGSCVSQNYERNDESTLQEAYFSKNEAVKYEGLSAVKSFFGLVTVTLVGLK